MGTDGRATATMVSESDALGAEPGTFTRILVLVDGSAPSTRAVQAAADLAQRDGAELALFAVVDRRLTYNAEAGIPPADLLSGLHREARGFLVHACLTLPPGLHAAELLREGEPAHEIVATARAWGADLLVVGRDAPTLLGRLLPGTVDQIAGHAPCPVLVVGPGATTAQQHTDGPHWWATSRSEDEPDRAREALT